MLSAFLFAVVYDIATDIGSEGALSELLYADDLDFMGIFFEGLRNKSMK